MTGMRATLIIPTQPTFLRKYRLAPRSKRPGQTSGLRVMHASHLCRVLSGKIFRDLRDALGARIKTDNVARITATLRLAEGESGIVQVISAS